MPNIHVANFYEHCLMTFSCSLFPQKSSIMNVWLVWQGFKYVSEQMGAWKNHRKVLTFSIKHEVI